jgi:hypothetical protein
MPAVFTKPRKPDTAQRRPASLPNITPKNGETQSEFAERFHTILGEAIANTEERNAACFKAWRDANGGQDNLERMASEHWDSDKYVLVPDVRVFKEHTAKNRDGSTSEYDLKALCDIIDCCNSRIEETGDYAPLVEGVHLPNAEQRAKGAEMPAVLAQVGPFRLGQFGNSKPKWAIFADEHWLRSQADKRHQLPRRSAEIWLEDDMADRFFDPIVALGAQTPRLDLGTIRYARRASHGRLVETYSAEGVEAYAADCPSDGNTFVTSFGDNQKHKAEYDQTAAAGNEGADMGQGTLSDQDIQKLLQALMATEPMQWVISQMDLGPDRMEGGQDESLMGGQPGSQPAQSGGQPPQFGQHGADANNDPSQSAGSGQDQSEGLNMTSDQKAFYDTLAPEQQAHYRVAHGGGGAPTPPAPPAKSNYARGQDGSVAEQYALLKRENDDLKRANEENAKRVEAIEKSGRKAEYARELSELKYQRGYIFDEAKELARVEQYSREQFDAHKLVIVENYNRAATASAMPVLPTPDLPAPHLRNSGSPTEAEAKQAEQYCREERAKGNNIKFVDAMQTVLAKRNAV